MSILTVRQFLVLRIPTRIRVSWSRALTSSGRAAGARRKLSPAPWSTDHGRWSFFKCLCQWPIFFGGPVEVSYIISICARPNGTNVSWLVSHMRAAWAFTSLGCFCLHEEKALSCACVVLKCQNFQRKPANTFLNTQHTFYSLFCLS